MSCDIREVLAHQEIPWQVSRGSIRDLELASRLYEIYPDHRFEPKPYRAFLAPAVAKQRATR